MPDLTHDVAGYPERRRNRLTGMRYSENGAYFVTICTRNRENLFWNAIEPLPEGVWLVEASPTEAAAGRPPGYLSENGIIAAKYVEAIHRIYKGVVLVDHYVIMPDHVHLLMSVHPETPGGRPIAAPTISSVVNQYKGRVSKAIGFSCWQKSFHDHIVRSDDEYRLIWEYIDANPGKWTEDRYYIGLSQL